MIMLARSGLGAQEIQTNLAAALYLLSCSFRALTAKPGNTVNRRRSSKDAAFTDRYAIERYLTMAFGRRPARTKKEYLALVPPQTHIGNSITLRKGGKTPLVFRPVDSSWELIGDIYGPRSQG